MQDAGKMYMQMSWINENSQLTSRADARCFSSGPCCCCPPSDPLLGEATERKRRVEEHWVKLAIVIVGAFGVFQMFSIILRCSRATMSHTEADKGELASMVTLADFDYYKILGLSKTASQEEIKKAVRKAVMKWHPDKNAGDKKADEMMKKVLEAKKVLEDSKERWLYDKSQKEGAGGETQKRKRDDAQKEEAKKEKRTGDKEPTFRKYSLVGSWDKWRSFIDFTHIGFIDTYGAVLGADVAVSALQEVEFKILCERNWNLCVYRDGIGGIKVGPNTASAAWKLTAKKQSRTLRVKICPFADMTSFGPFFQIYGDRPCDSQQHQHVLAWGQLGPMDLSHRLRPDER